MTIKKVNIYRFKNLSNVEFELNNNSVAFSGKNAIGKTNTILAIYWCLTGGLLDGSNDNSAIIPNVQDADFEIAVSVKVELSNGTTIERQLVWDKDKYSTKFIINNKDYSAKKGEAIIDDEFGLTRLTLHDTKAFKVKRFLLNPLYINQIDKKSLRDYFCDLLGLDTLPKEIFDKLPEIDKKSLSPYIFNNEYNVSKVSKLVKDAKTVLESNSKFWENVCTYLTKYQKLNKHDLDYAIHERDDAKAKIIAFTPVDVALTNYINGVISAYNLAFVERTGLNVKLIQPTKSDSYELCFNPLINEKSVELKDGSTSEQVLYGLKFVDAIAKTFNFPKLPVIFDECEVFDLDSLKKINDSANTQVITARVENDSNEIQVRVI